MTQNKSFLYSIYGFFYTLFNGYSPEVNLEIKRVRRAMDKVDARECFLKKDFKKNRNELFRLLSLKEMLVNYNCDLLGYNYPKLGFSGSANSKLVDEILEPKW